MFMFELPNTTDSNVLQVDKFADVNAVAITGDQLNRAFQVKGALRDERLRALTAYAENEGLAPISHAAQALVLRMGLVADFLDGPGIDNDDWCPMLEAIARVRLVDDEGTFSISDGGLCFDEDQFDEILAFAREMRW